jgi:uncharacterized protein
VVVTVPTLNGERIEELGYGLEQTLSDPRCAEIIGEDILPHFREGRMELGIVAGADAIITSLEAAAPQRKEAA